MHDPEHQLDVEDRQRRALAVPTRRHVYDLIAGADHPIGVAQLAAACGVHQNTVRLHLATLMDAGLIAQESEVVRHQGRPGYRYRAVAAPPPSSSGAAAGAAYRHLVTWLADAVRTHSSAREAGRRAGAEEATAVAAAAGARGADADPVVSMLRSFTRLGFDPVWEPGGAAAGHADDQVVLRTCPFADVAAEDPATICSLHLGLAEGLVQSAGGLAVDGLDVATDPAAGGCRVHLRP